MTVRKAKTRPARGNTEQAFIAVSTRLFAERGYNGTSIADIAKELGLTTASLYYHLHGKQQLLLRVLEAGTAEFHDCLDEITAGDQSAHDQLRAAIRNHLYYVLHRREAVAVFLRERRFLEPPLKQQYEAGLARYDRQFTALLRDCMAEGSIPDDDPSLTRLAILGMINWVVEWYDPAGPRSSDEITDHFTDLILERMLRVDP